MVNHLFQEEGLFSECRLELLVCYYSTLNPFVTGTKLGQRQQQTIERSSL